MFEGVTSRYMLTDSLYHEDPVSKTADLSLSPQQLTCHLVTFSNGFKNDSTVLNQIRAPKIKFELTFCENLQLYCAVPEMKIWKCTRKSTGLMNVKTSFPVYEIFDIELIQI